MRTLRIAGTDFHVGFYVPPGARARLLTNDQDDEDDDSRRFDPAFLPLQHGLRWGDSPECRVICFKMKWCRNW